MLSRQALRFGLTGLLATGVHVVVATGLIRFAQYNPVIGNGIAFCLATIVSYLVNTTWSFSSRPRRRNLARFIGVSAVGLLLAMILSALADLAGLSYGWGIACVAVGVPPVTFLLHRVWTYR